MMGDGIQQARYRLSGADELYETGMDEYLNGDGVALVEWPTQAREAIPARHLAVHIEKTDDDQERIYELTPVGGFALKGEEALFECFGH